MNRECDGCGNMRTELCGKCYYDAPVMINWCPIGSVFIEESR